jgi:hypothetical protein
MRHTRRLIAILIGCATWCLASSSVAYAKIVDDPGPAGIPVVTSPGSSGTPLWQILAFVALGVLLAVAIVGLGYSRSRSRKSQTPFRS